MTNRHRGAATTLQGVETLTGRHHHRVAAAAAEVMVRSLPVVHLNDLASLPGPWPARLPAPSKVEHATLVLTRAMTREGVVDDIPWWRASGANVTAALCIRDGLDEARASYLVSAAYHVLTLIGRDRGEDTVLRLAERAAAYRKGTQHQ